IGYAVPFVFSFPRSCVGMHRGAACRQQQYEYYRDLLLTSPKQRRWLDMNKTLSLQEQSTELQKEVVCSILEYTTELSH
ncbi:MAG: hypothetical protein KAG53_09895, partial [Endozoicomonadaceae bacterium]|nr:hypothetical protein [Endozoicomonadaceae bacterium]